jgi:ABC-type multidrug transport system permease subunit
MPLAFASSAFVPVETMPTWLQPIVVHQPVSVIVDAVRGLLLAQPAGAAVWQALAWCAAIVAACLPASVVLYRRMGRG